MADDHVDTFLSSLDGLVDTADRIPPSEFPTALDRCVREPAVGVPLPYEEVSLADTAVQTDFDAADLEAAATGVTPVGLGIASYGTVTIRAEPAGDELVSLYADRHLAIVHAEDIIADMPAAFDQLSAEFADGASTQVLATGASATADMGGLIQGVHGPGGVDVLVVDP